MVPFFNFKISKSDLGDYNDILNIPKTKEDIDQN